MGIEAVVLQEQGIIGKVVTQNVQFTGNTIENYTNITHYFSYNDYRWSAVIRVDRQCTEENYMATLYIMNLDTHEADEFAISRGKPVLNQIDLDTINQGGIHR